MQLPYSSQLNIGYLSRIFDNTSECYKLFWFQAIMKKLSQNRIRFTFDELVNEMIADAWYMVTEYHLNLGPKDTLEAVVKHIAGITNFKSSEKKENLINFLESCEDKEVMRMKKILTLNVPYRLLSSFLPDIKGKAWNVPLNHLTENINKHDNIIYTFVVSRGLQSEIEIEDSWVTYLLKNSEIVNGWIRYNMIRYLQKRNPNVPGIIDKLSPPQERKLEKVIRYWKMVIEVNDNPIYEIYGNNVAPLSA